MTAPTARDLLLAYASDLQADRAPGLSWSAVGGCRRKAGYMMTGTEPSNPVEGGVQAAMGTAIHAPIAEVGQKLWPEDLWEHKVVFADIPGTLDHYSVADERLDDWKTTSQRFLDSVRAKGMPLSWRYQRAGYAAGLTVQGYRVRTTRICAIARDTGDQEVFDDPFRQQDVADTLEWVRGVQSTPVEMLNRDYLPESTFCQSCPYLDVCWTNQAVPGKGPLTALWSDDPDAARWATELAEARAEEKAAKDKAHRAKGALEALKPDGGGRVAVAGYDKELSWSESSSWVLDQDAVTAEFKAAGASPPMKRATKVTLNLVKPKAASKAKREPEGQAEAS